MFKKIEKESFYYGFPVVLMTTKEKQSQTDTITVISSIWTLGKTMVVDLGLENQGFLNLTVGAEATFNIAKASSWEKVEHIAKATGNPKLSDYKKKAGYSYCADKFALGGWTKLNGKTVATARIKECPLQIETVVTEITERAHFAIVECEMRGIFVAEDLLYDDSYIDVNKWSPLIYKFREYTSANQALGSNFRFQEYKSAPITK